MKIDIRPRLPIYGLRMSDANDHATALVPFASQNFNLRGMWSLGTGDFEVYSREYLLAWFTLDPYRYGWHFDSSDYDSTFRKHRQTLQESVKQITYPRLDSPSWIK